MKKLSALRHLIPTQMNPIVVKELRQSVRSRFVAGVLLLFLAVELFGVGATLLSSGSNYNGINYFAGRDTFHFLYITLSTACLLFIPAYAAVRLAMERWDNNLDLMYITTIKPRAVIKGKLFAAMVIALLLFSAAAPFMSFSYLLRGIDLPSIFIAIVFVFIYVIAVTQVMIFLACLPTSRAFKVILGLVAIGGLIQSLVVVNFAGWGIIRSGFGSKFNDPDFWVMASAVTVSVFLGVGMLQRMSVALISPVSANRALPVRRYATIVWAVTGLGTFGLATYNSEGLIMMAWLIPAISVLCMSLIWGLGERTKLSSRVRRTIPKNFLLRRLAFLFYNGPAGAVCWTAALATLTYIFSLFAATFSDSSSSGDMLDAIQAMISVYLYTIAYGLIAVFIWRKFLFRRVKSSTIGVIACMLMAVGALLPSLVALLKNTNSYDWDLAWYVGNIFTVASAKHKDAHLTFAIAFTIPAIAINGFWFLNQMRAFKREPEDQNSKVDIERPTSNIEHPTANEETLSSES
jgi:hypothetical protein